MTERGWYAAIIAIAGAAVLTVGLYAMTPRAKAGASVDLAERIAAAAPTAAHKLDPAVRDELRCLALNVYWEARSEPLDGQMAVAAVTLNRVADPRFPEDICSVVQQGGEMRRHRCQFSWWCDGKKDDPLEIESWRRAEIIARLSLAGTLPDPTHGALWYHADYVKPTWSAAKNETTKIGRHIFYVTPEMAVSDVPRANNRVVASR